MQSNTEGTQTGRADLKGILYYKYNAVLQKNNNRKLNKKKITILFLIKLED